MQTELFESSIEKSDPASAQVSYEHWMWAEMVIREASEEAAADDRSQIDFMKVQIRWEEIVSLLNFLDLGLYRKNQIETQVMQWHEGICSVLLSLGSVLDSWAKAIDSSFLESINYDKAKNDRLMDSLRESYDQWHVNRSEDRINLILSAIDDEEV